MDVAISNVSQQLSQLDTARNVVLSDAKLYSQIIQGVLPIIGANAQLELRRWGVEFMAETFASPVLSARSKEQLSPLVLQYLDHLLFPADQDSIVSRNAIQIAANVYPHIFRIVVNKPLETYIWETMSSIKQKILSRWSTSPNDIKVCCIKFAQRVVHIQTTAIADPRRPEKNETSLAIVPKNHRILQIPSLEAEASGLLDRLLDVFYENTSDPILIDATLNCLSILIRTRQSISNKIISTILNFSPLKHPDGPLTPSMRVKIRSMERTTRALLISVLKRLPNHPMFSRMQQYVDRLTHSKIETLEESSRKRGASTEPRDFVDNAKRMRLGLDTPTQMKIPPMPPGPNTVAQLFSLTEDNNLSSFDVKQLPSDLVVKITIPLLTRIDPEPLDQAAGAIRDRYFSLTKKQIDEHTQLTVPPMEDDDDYEPEYEPNLSLEADVSTETTDSVSARIEPDLALRPFSLPQSQPLTKEESNKLGKDAIGRVFAIALNISQPSKAVKGTPSAEDLGFGRLAASSFSRDSWLLLIMRLATRASAVFESDQTVRENETVTKYEPISDSIRVILYRYILEDFRSRINVAISWANEEWYNDRIQKTCRNEGDTSMKFSGHYDHWVVKLLEGFLPYLDARDKVLIRFLSEVPELNDALVERVKSLANDPERVNLCVQSFHYLVLMRPPAREKSLDALQDLYNNIEESRPLVSKVLCKWRPTKLPHSEKLSANIPGQYEVHVPAQPEAAVQVTPQSAE